MMKKIFVEAHKLTRKMKEEYPEIDYQVQFGLYVKYLLEENSEIDYETAEIKSWFLIKNFTPDEKYVIEVSDREILRETEKAVNIKFTSKYGNLFSWIPKSVFMTKEDERKEEERMNKRIAKFEEGKRRYEELVKFAKENGVKYVRIGLRKETIINKIKEAGLEVPAELIA